MQIKIPGYSIVNTLHQSAAANVFLALEEDSVRELVLKVISFVSPPPFPIIVILKLQCQRLVRFDHPNVVQFFHADCCDDYYFLAQEYLPGQSLSHKRFELDLLARLRVIIDIANALKYVGEQGWVHAALTPDNIRLHETDNRAILLGFRLQFVDPDAITDLPTANFLSPEQLQGQLYDARADLYSLGVVFFLLLTDHLPYINASLAELASTAPRVVVPSLPPHLHIFQPIVNRLLAVDPAQRYQTAGECIADLDALSEETVLAAIQGATYLLERTPPAPEAFRVQTLHSAVDSSIAHLSIVEPKQEDQPLFLEQNFVINDPLFRPVRIVEPEVGFVDELNNRSRYADSFPVVLLGVVSLSLVAAIFYTAEQSISSKTHTRISDPVSVVVRKDNATNHSINNRVQLIIEPDLEAQASALRLQLVNDFSLATDLVVIYRAALRGTDTREHAFAHEGLHDLQRMFGDRILTFLEQGAKDAAFKERELALRLFDKDELLPELTDTFALFD
jgi:serine/threonine protein kinase